MKAIVWSALLMLAAGGCISPYAGMNPKDVKVLAEDRYAAAQELPAAPKEAGFKRVYAFQETREAIQNIRQKDATVTLADQTLTQAQAVRKVDQEIDRTEEAAGITPLDWSGKVGKWFVGIPITVFATPFQAVLTLAESPPM